MTKRMIDRVKSNIFVKRIRLGCGIARRDARKPISRKEQLEFAIRHFSRLYVQPYCSDKSVQISKLLRKVDIVPAESKYFLYSVDWYKAAVNKLCVLGNMTVDYGRIVHGNFCERRETLSRQNTAFSSDMVQLLDAMRDWRDKCRKDKSISERFGPSLDAIDSLFERDANTFFEALQRILFFNQFLWQAGHVHNGLGRLDVLLYDLYREDLQSGRLTQADAMDMLKDFLKVLHAGYRFKSQGLLGDTGQIIILGGLSEDGTYCCNELTYRFIEAARELRLPDPKILLRCADSMPDDLMQTALSCIATGIGAPLLSNDDVVIPALCAFGYAKKDAYNYVTAACWEPITVGGSCDGANCSSLNFAVPFVQMLNQEDSEQFTSADDLTQKYITYLTAYTEDLLEKLSSFRWEEAPLISLLSESAISSGKDITRGGYKYFNIGLTSVGLGTVVNSLLNLDRLVFSSSQFTLAQLNTWRKENFQGHEELLQEFKSLRYGYGVDDENALSLSKRIIATVNKIFSERRTDCGEKFRFGLSSPGYISDALKVDATFDGRKAGDPFPVHISAQNAASPTELLSFAASLGYTGSCINGNVADFFVTPNALRADTDKYQLLLRAAFKQGIFQTQINVVESRTLIEAKNNPDLFPNLIVRVWGFSAYFNDLPEEYKDLLIRRAIESEKAA